jgi:hypothetical protein
MSADPDDAKPEIPNGWASNLHWNGYDGDHIRFGVPGNNHIGADQ